MQKRPIPRQGSRHYGRISIPQILLIHSDEAMPTILKHITYKIVLLHDKDNPGVEQFDSVRATRNHVKDTTIYLP